MKPKKKKTETRAEKRVAIAKDVISKLNKKRYEAEQGVYCAAKDIIWPEDEHTEIQTMLKGKKCNVCALGSLFVSAIDKYDKLMFDDPTFDGINSRNDTYLKRFFSGPQLDLMESAFERDHMGVDSYDYTPTKTAAVAFGCRYDFPDARLRAIMNNVIRNDGKFIPPKPTKRELQELEEYGYW